MTRRRPMVVVALGLGAAIGPGSGCGDGGETADGFEVGGAGCSFCEPDEDLCTEERCDPALGRCVSVPRDAANACRFDWHCDDGIDCTVDRCARDACDFERCRHDLAPGCSACGAASQCVDGDPCSQESCVAEVCTMELVEGCEPRCDPEVAAAAPDDGLWLGVVEAAGPCPACPCATGIALRTADEVLGLETGGAARCERACDGATAGALVCRPLALGVRYVVWGARADATIATEGWCLASASGLTPGRYAGRILWSTGPALTFGLVADDGNSVVLEPEPCAGDCVVDVPPQIAVVEALEGWGRVVRLLVVGPNDVEEVLVRLLPGARGYHGTVRLGSVAVSGEVLLERP